MPLLPTPKPSVGGLHSCGTLSRLPETGYAQSDCLASLLFFYCTVPREAKAETGIECAPEFAGAAASCFFILILMASHWPPINFGSPLAGNRRLACGLCHLWTQLPSCRRQICRPQFRRGGSQNDLTGIYRAIHVPFAKSLFTGVYAGDSSGSVHNSVF